MDNRKTRVLAPSIYGRFQCKGASCRYNCCQGWNITMSKDEYHRWKKCGILPKGKEENGKVRICPDERKTNRHYAEIILDKSQNCPYLTDEGLCQIQKEHGVKEMTLTCRRFPRQTHRYFGQTECSLSLGCEKVLELLLEEKDGLLLEEEKPGIFEIYGSDFNIHSRKKYSKLRSYYDIQTLSLAVLQTEEMTLENRLLILGMAMERIDTFYAEDRADDVPTYVLEVIRTAQLPDSWKILDSFPDNRPLAVFNTVMSALITLGFPETVKKDIVQRAGEGSTQKKDEGSEYPELDYYQECKDQFRRWSKSKEYFFENVMVMCFLWLNIPFRDPEKSLWENYLYFVWVWVMLKGILCLSLSEDSTDEEMIDCCVMTFRKIGHNTKAFMDIIDAFRKEGGTPAHIAILLRSC